MLTELNLSDWARASHGQLMGDDQAISTICTDSRTFKAGDTYVALRGDHHDGHDYLASVITEGAAALVVEQTLAHASVSQLQLPNSRKALGDLAGLLRDRFTGQVVALTGSAGKTSTRAMLQAIFSQQPGLLATKGNFNNDIGVPKTWFQLKAEHQRVLLELGANQPGDIAFLAGFSRPHISLLLNASEAHTEGFGGLEQVRAEKGEIFKATVTDGLCVLNRDDPAYEQWRMMCGKRRTLSFGQHPEADVCLLAFNRHSIGSELQLLFEGNEMIVQWPLLGRQMAMNAAAATAVALAVGFSLAQIRQGLMEVKPEPGRLEVLRGQHGGRLIHDAYNASPAAVFAAIDVLAEEEDSLLVLGDMAELGDQSTTLHQAVGRYAKHRVKDFWTLGTDSAEASKVFDGQHFDSLEQLLAALPGRLTTETTVLIKGARSSGMERVVAALVREN